MQEQATKAPRAPGPSLTTLFAVGVAGLVLGLVAGVLLAGEPFSAAPSDPAYIVASTIDDLNTAYVYGDMTAIDAIFGDDLAFNSGQGRDLVGPAGAGFFKERAGTGAVARRVTEPVENVDGGYTFEMELLPPNELQPRRFESHAMVEDGRMVRLEQGDRVLRGDSAAGG